MKNSFIKLFLFTAILFAASCETIDLDQTEDPSGVPDNLLDPVYVFNHAQLELADFVNSSNAFTQRVTRQMAMTGGNTYDNAFAPVNFNNNWNTAYRMLNAIKTMEPNAVKNNQFYVLGASKVIRAYVLITLTDMYGDIPLTEALQGNGNLSPKFDKSANVYKQVLTELDAAIEILQRTGSNDERVQDLYYTSTSGWVKLANTLKLKMYNTARLAGADIGVNIGTAMLEVIAQDNYIKEIADDFAFQYGNSRFSPNARHPLYNDQYELGGGAYIANYYMWAMTTEKDITVGANGPSTSGFGDPRVNFYFYKQDANPADENEFTLPGRSRPAHYSDQKYSSFFVDGRLTPYTTSNWTGQTGIQSNGYWGRDHGDNSGIPPDDTKRTVGGIFPIGGAYGVPGTVQTGGDKGALGAGIMPILLSSYVHFMKAEAFLELGIGTVADAKAEMLLGISQSIDKVINFKPNYQYVAGTAPNMTQLNQQKADYLAYIGAKFDDVSQAQKLELIIKEYYIAAWGNGIEPYNNYRRTGYPSNFQPTLEPVSGAFFYTALYPGESVNNNPNAPTNNRTRKVFWDKGNLQLH